jgi:beta-glucosidase
MRRLGTAAAAAALLLAACASGTVDTTTSAPVPAPTTTTPAPTTTVEALPYLDASLSIEERVDDLLVRMTLAEKIAQMTLVEKNSIAPSDLGNLGIGGLLSGGGGAPSTNTAEGWAEMVRDFQERTLGSRLAIPLLYGIDAVHGHNNVPGAVIFPHNIGLGAANDPDLMERIGRITALEVLATNIHWNYAPAVSVPLDIRWGRTYEGYSQDTAIVSELATAYLRGMQRGDLSDPTTILGTPKHFVGDGGTVWGTATTNGYWIDQGVTEADEETLRAIHLPPYLELIDAGAMSIMASYSSWGGMKMHAQRYLITDVLKGELGFEGFVVSDWEAIDQITDDYHEAVVTAINAGIDMNMVPRDYRTFIDDLTSAVEAGDVPMERIDDAVRRILAVKFSLGLFEQPFGDEALLAEVGSDAHRAVAREAVAKSLVLLEDDDDLLPLSPDEERIWVAGGAADDLGIQMGGWSISWQGGMGARTEGTTILEAIEGAVSPGTVVTFDRSGRFDGIAEDESPLCITVVGELPYAEGAGDDGSPELLAGDVALLASMDEVCADLVVIILSGRPLLLDGLESGWEALIAAWLPGTEGDGVADVLFGAVPFTGTLSYEWPRSIDQVPFDPSNPSGDPRYPMGHGLTHP